MLSRAGEKMSASTSGGRIVFGGADGHILHAVDISHYLGRMAGGSLLVSGFLDHLMDWSQTQKTRAQCFCFTSEFPTK